MSDTLTFTGQRDTEAEQYQYTGNEASIHKLKVTKQTISSAFEYFITGKGGGLDLLMGQCIAFAYKSVVEMEWRLAANGRLTAETADDWSQDVVIALFEEMRAKPRKFLTLDGEQFYSELFKRARSKVREIKKSHGNGGKDGEYLKKVVEAAGLGWDNKRRWKKHQSANEGFRRVRTMRRAQGDSGEYEVDYLSDDTYGPNVDYRTWKKYPPIPISTMTENERFFMAAISRNATERRCDGIVDPAFVHEGREYTDIDTSEEGVVQAMRQLTGEQWSPQRLRRLAYDLALKGKKLRNSDRPRVAADQLNADRITRRARMFRQWSRRPMNLPANTDDVIVEIPTHAAQVMKEAA